MKCVLGLPETDLCSCVRFTGCYSLAGFRVCKSHCTSFKPSCVLMLCIVRALVVVLVLDLVGVSSFSVLVLLYGVLLRSLASRTVVWIGLIERT